MLNPLAIWSGPDLLIILAIVLLVFGAAKLPDLARGSGQALRIFKAEARGMKDDEERAKAIEAKDADAVKLAELNARQAELDAERAKLTHPDA